MDPVADTIALLDYRRRVADLYRTVRNSPPGPATWHAWRTGRDELFAAHSQSPLDDHDSRRGEGLCYFDYDPEWRFVLEVEPTQPGDTMAVHSGAGSTPLTKIGQIRLPVDNEPSLVLFRFKQYAQGIFLPFRDETAGASTYGGGRYLLDSPKGADLGDNGTQVILDFNYAYNPSCAYSERWSCPMPPRGNWIQNPIPVGERL